jgi:hypothetical protein
MDLDNFIIDITKKRRRGESWQKKQQLLNKHRRGELHWTVVGEDRSGEEVKQSSCCHMVERPLQIHQATAAYQKNIEQPLSA